MHICHTVLVLAIEHGILFPVLKKTIYQTKKVVFLVVAKLSMQFAWSIGLILNLEKVRKTIKNYGKKCERLWENRVILYFFSRHIKLQQKVGTYMAWYIQDEDTFYALFFSIFCWNAWYIKKVILKNDFIEVIFVCADGECLWHYDLTICESSFHFLRIW